MNYKIKNTCSHGNCMNKPYDWKWKHFTTNSMNDYALYTFFGNLSEGLPHIICCDDSSGSWEKSNQHKIYYIKYYFARGSCNLHSAFCILHSTFCEFVTGELEVIWTGQVKNMLSQSLR